MGKRSSYIGDHMKNEVCEICVYQQPSGVYSSGIAPVSLSLCRTFRDKVAEKIELVLMWITS